MENNNTTGTETAPATTKPARKGYRLVPCRGAAHSNPLIDNCMCCMPRWGWVEVKNATVNFDDREWVYSHGGTPRGRGGWLFSTERVPTNDQIFSAPSGTLAEAKKAAREFYLAACAKAEYDGEIDVYILP